MQLLLFKELKNEKGAILPLLIIGLFVMTGMVALAVDGAFIFKRKVDAQNAADIASIRAAHLLLEDKVSKDDITNTMRYVVKANLNAAGISNANAKKASEDLVISYHWNDHLVKLSGGTSETSLFFANLLGLNEANAKVTMQSAAIYGDAPLLVPETTAPSDEPTINVVEKDIAMILMIDLSGSMDGTFPDGSRKVDVMKDALKDLMNDLRDTDMVSLVAFAGKADVILPFIKMDDYGKTFFTRIIDGIDTTPTGGGVVRYDISSGDPRPRCLTSPTPEPKSHEKRVRPDCHNFGYLQLEFSQSTQTDWGLEQANKEIDLSNSNIPPHMSKAAVMVTDGVQTIKDVWIAEDTEDENDETNWRELQLENCNAVSADLCNRNKNSCAQDAQDEAVRNGVDPRPFTAVCYSIYDECVADLHDPNTASIEEESSAKQANNLRTKGFAVHTIGIGNGSDYNPKFMEALSVVKESKVSGTPMEFKCGTPTSSPAGLFFDVPVPGEVISKLREIVTVTRNQQSSTHTINNADGEEAVQSGSKTPRLISYKTLVE